MNTMASHRAKTNVRTVFGIVEMVLFTGVIFGWANMVLILKEEEYFKDLCAGNSTLSSSEDSENCGRQDERLALIFTISVFAFNVAGLIGGSLLDKLGTRLVRLIACFLFFLTGVFAGFLEKGTANLMFPIVICLAFSGMFVAITLFQIAVLHKKHQFIVSSSLSGALDSSSVVFLVFKTIYDAGLGLRWILVGYAVLAVVVLLVNTFFLLPKASIAAEQDEYLEKEQKHTIKLDAPDTKPDQTTSDVTKQKSTNQLGISNQAITPDTTEGDQKNNESSTTRQKSTPELGITNKGITPDSEGNQGLVVQSVVNMKEFDDINLEHTDNGKRKNYSIASEQPAKQNKDIYSSGWRYILTAKYIWLLFFHSLVQLRLWFFVASLNTYLVNFTDDDKDEIEAYSRVFGIAQFFGFVFAPFTGLVMNIKPRSITNEYFGPMMSYTITLLLCLTLGALVLVPVLEVQYLTFVIQVAMRAFLYASLISFILKAFPVEHYGKLYGVCNFLAALISLLQYPAVVLIDGPSNGNPYWVNLGFLILSFTPMGFPLYLWLSNRNIGEEVTSF